MISRELEAIVLNGDDFRLVVVIKFTPQHVFIRFIGTHAEYDKITDIQNL